MLRKFHFPVLATVLLVPLASVLQTHGQAAPRRIEVTAKRFDFTPAEITVEIGETFVLVLKSVDVAHGVRFRELNVTVNAAKGQTSEITITPDKTGTFVGHCSVFCGSGHGSMALTLHVVK